MPELLKIKELSAGYGFTKILKGINLEVMPSEIVAIIGPNGAGKTTLLKTIFGLTKVYAGSIHFKGRKIDGLKPSELLVQGICFLPQEQRVFPTLSVEENLQMGAIFNCGKEKLKEKLEETYLEFPELRKRRNSLAFSLSGGQQQVLALGRAFIQSPQLLILDEPSLGLAPKVIHTTFQKIISLKKYGISILLVEQNARKAIETADRTYVLENGQISLEGGKEIAKNDKIRKIYDTL